MIKNSSSPLGTPSTSSAMLALLALVIATAGCITRHKDYISAAFFEPYPCHLAAGAITVDGNLDEPAWQKADLVSISYLLEPRNVSELPNGNVRLLWNKEYFYIGFDCADDDVWSYSNKPDDELWNGDVAECFFKPSTDEPLYFEFVLAPNGTLFDSRFPSRGAGGYLRFRDWSSGAKTASVIRGTDNDPTDNDQGYTLEVAIPINAFPEAARPKDGATWTFGAFRYDYSKSYEDPLLLMSIPEAKGHGYHSYEYYQPLRFEK